MQSKLKFMTFRVILSRFEILKVDNTKQTQMLLGVFKV